METIEDLPKIDTTQHLDNVVSRQEYDQLLDDYNKLKERNESKTTSEQDPDVFESYIGRIARFEYLMKQLQEDFLEMKANVRSRTFVNGFEQNVVQRSRGEDSSAINYVMTIVHPKSRTK